MYIEQLYTSCLSGFTYYIESDGIAAVVDPMRDVESVLDLAKTRGAQVKYIFETHFHADFVSGHIDLSNKTGAKIVYGPGASAGYEIYSASDNEEFLLGSVKLRLLHTPGHTLESYCLLLLDERHNPHSVFTGDTLFVDDVGRPDLAVSNSKTKEDLAGMLYESINAKLMQLPNYVIVYPAHGAGSACGKVIGSAFHTTIGEQKKSNYALKATDKNNFIKLVLEGLTAPPKYFFRDAAINREGYEPLSELLKRNHRALNVNEVKNVLEEKDAIILDTRSWEEFSSCFIPGSINIPLEGPMAPTAGTVLNHDSTIVIVATEGKVQETIVRLARVGIEKIAGYLQGGAKEWKETGNTCDSIDTISANAFEERFRYNSCYVIDVRNSDEWISGFVSGAKLISLPDLENHIEEFDKSKTCFVYCAKGYRSVVAASLLKKHGLTKVVHVSGGIQKIKKTKISIGQLTAFND